MDIKTISVQLTKEERQALYEAATRECRRPEQQVRYILRHALGISELLPQTNSDASGMSLQASTGISR